MTEEQIERAVERAFNKLDADLMANRLTQEEYDYEAKVIHEWAESEYRERRCGRDAC